MERHSLSLGKTWAFLQEVIIIIAANISLSAGLSMNTTSFNVHNRDFLGGTVFKTLRSQCRGPRFHPWLGN